MKQVYYVKYYDKFVWNCFHFNHEKTTEVNTSTLEFALHVFKCSVCVW